MDLRRICFLLLILIPVATQARWFSKESSEQQVQQHNRYLLDVSASLLDNCHIVYDKSFTSSDFPANFSFGAATAAHQVEGAASEDGRGPSIWDTFEAVPGKIFDGSDASVADDSYHKYKEDILLLKNMGMDTYRFSISWSRVLPNGTGPVNPLGIQYYNDLIDSLLAAGIRPAVTLYHWDLPQALDAEIGGWLNSKIVDYFEEYASLCFKNFGDRVKLWTTFNEPQSSAVLGYATGDMAPGRCSDRSKCTYGNSSTEPYVVVHHILLSHAAAVNAYRTQYEPTQHGRVGITLDSQFYFPETNSEENRLASETALAFSFGWFADPLIKGDYPEVMKEHLGERLPKWEESAKSSLKGSLDFIGINSYTGTYVRPGSPPAPGTGNPWSDSWVETSQYSENGIPIGESTASSWLKVVPSAIYNLVMWVSQRYPGIPLLMTENGVSQPGDAPLQELLCDQQRVSFYESYLKELLQAIREGANVEAYFAWSLLDNFEWARGYSERFGLTYVDFKDPNRPRIPKASSYWWSKFLHAPGRNT